MINNDIMNYATFKIESCNFDTYKQDKRYINRSFDTFVALYI